MAGPSMRTAPPALVELAVRLRCPHCLAAPLECRERQMRCPAGHSFDVARQGYVSLLDGGTPHRGDDAAMVAAREQFLGEGHFRPLSDALGELVAEHAPADPGLVIDLAGGTGHHLAAVLDGLEAAWGLTLDLSAPALRRAARSHPRAGAAAADVWAGLPVESGRAGVVLSVFGPRNAAEIERVLSPGGTLVVAGPAPEHLAELRAAVGAIGIDPRKRERLDAALASFAVLARRSVRWRMELGAAQAGDLLGMGPNAHHLDPEQLGAVLAGLPDPIEVGGSVDLTVLRPHRGDDRGR